MSRKLFRKVFPLLAVVLLAPWPVAYAHTYDNSVGGGESVRIEAAEASVMPTWTAFRRAIGGVSSPGDLFYIDATGNPLDISLDLYITNPDELIHYLRYLILKVAVYMEDAGGQWQQITSQNSTALPVTYITLQNSPASFTLPGLTRYKITIESGSYHSFPFHPNNGDISPSFYLNVNPS